MYFKNDKKGRLTFVTEHINHGHSVCNNCNKDMPGCWDVVCYFCNRTFCYKCSKDANNKWFCKECFALYSNTFEGAIYLLVMSIKEFKATIIKSLTFWRKAD